MIEQDGWTPSDAALDIIIKAMGKRGLGFRYNKDRKRCLGLRTILREAIKEGAAHDDQAQEGK